MEREREKELGASGGPSGFGDGKQDNMSTFSASPLFSLSWRVQNTDTCQSAYRSPEPPPAASRHNKM